MGTEAWLGRTPEKALLGVVGGAGLLTAATRPLPQGLAGSASALHRPFSSPSLTGLLQAAGDSRQPCLGMPTPLAALAGPLRQ